MWDADLVSRVRDRKLNEIMIFASMAKIDSSNIDTYIDIIVSLGDDIDACDTLIDTDGESEIALDRIEDPEYLGRLSPGEKADEDAFNALKSSPYSEESVPEDIGDYVRQLISDAVESLRSADEGVSKDAFIAVKDELGIVRKRNEELSKDLDFRMTENTALAEDLKNALEERNGLVTEVERLNKLVKELEASSSRMESMMEELAEANEEIGVLRNRVEALQNEVSSKDADIITIIEERDAALQTSSDLYAEVEELKEECADQSLETATESDAGKEDDSVGSTTSSASESDPKDDAAIPVQEGLTEADLTEPAVVRTENDVSEAPQATDERPVVDRILTDAQREVVEATRTMKDSKIDEFIDKSLSGEVDETVCDNIVSFLKVDISICDALLGMDYTSLDSIMDGFRKILSIIDDAPEPHSQSVYSNSLSAEQSVVEYGYNKVIEHIQDVMLRRYANML